MIKGHESKAFESAKWTIGTNIVLLFFKFGTIAFLARMISPEIFGLNATFVMIVGFLNVLTSPFINKNLVLLKNKPSLTSSGFFVSIIHSTFLALIIYFSAPVVQGFFKEVSNLSLYIQVGSWLLIPMAINNVFTSIVEKNMDFKYLAIRKFFTVVIGAGVLPILVIFFFGLEFWALIIGLYVKEVLDIVFLKYKIKFELIKFSLSDLKEIYKDFFSITMNVFVNKIALNGDFFIISKYLGGVALGFYSKAYQLMTLPTTLVSDALQKVGLASLSDLADDQELQRNLLSRIYYLTGVIIFPLMVIFFYSSEFLILLLLGRNWLESFPSFQILCFGIFFRLAYKIPVTILQVRRQFFKLLIIQGLYAVLIIVSCYSLSSFGIIGVSYGTVLALIVHFIVISGMLAKELEMDLMVIYGTLKRPLIIFVSGFAFVETILYLLDTYFFIQDTYLITFLLSSVYGLILIAFLVLLPEKVFGSEISWWREKFLKNQTKW